MFEFGLDAGDGGEMALGTLTEEHRQYLASHNLAVLATGKRDGSPQVSTIYYGWDGERAYISVTSDRAKWKNAMRNPNVALLVADGRRQLIVYGTAEGITDRDERDRWTIWLREQRGADVPADREAFRAELDAANRVILVVTPQRAFQND